MLPRTYSRQDEKWLTERFDELMRRTGINHARVIAEKYAIAYEDTYERTPEPHKKRNKASFDANTRLIRAIKATTQKAALPWA